MSVEAVLPDGSRLDLRADRWAHIRRRLASGQAQPPRLVYAAAHIAMRESYAHVPHSPASPGASDEIAPHIDWEATDAIRRRLASLGFGIAEAMDTAQRYEVGWPIARQLIERCGRLRLATGFIAGAGADQLRHVRSAASLVDAVVEQARFIRGCGGWPMILAMPWLSMSRCDEETYVDVYTSIIRQSEGPLFIHWLGSMFLPSLEGYFPGRSFERIMGFDPSRVRGCKLSLLDPAMEKAIRVDLAPRNQIMLTGDDFHFGTLMEGCAIGSTDIGERAAAVGDLSHGLLGIFDAIADPASLALRAMAAGDLAGYREIMNSCEHLGRVAFEPPTDRYKAGLAFLAWLNGHQPNRMLVNHLELLRDAAHLTRLVRAAEACGAITDPETAAPRLARLPGSGPNP